MPSAFEDDRAASDNGKIQRGGTDGLAHTLADRVISEQLSYEAVGGDITALFDTAISEQQTRTLPFEDLGGPQATEVASSSTSAPIYAIPNVVSHEPLRKYAKINFDCADEIWPDESEGEADPNDEPDNFENYFYHLFI